MKKEWCKIAGKSLGAVVILGMIAWLLWQHQSIQKYTVHFDSVGGTKVPSQKVQKEETAQKPSNPVREGYLFLGWYYQEELFDFHTPIKENIQLVARWQKIDGNR